MQCQNDMIVTPETQLCYTRGTVENKLYEMNPKEFMRQTGATYSDLAEICDRPYATVAKWFCKGTAHREPSRQDLKILTLAYQLKNLEGSDNATNRS